MKYASEIVNPHKLYVFSKVVINNNITNTAKELHMTQPAVTNIIRQLERHFGQKLIVNQGKKIKITDAGLELAKYWYDFEKIYDQMNKKLYDYERGEIGAIKVVMVSTAKYFMPPLFSQFLQIFPMADFKCHITHRLELMKNICENDYDLGIVTNPPHHPDIASHLISENKLVFVCNINHPLTKSKTIHFKDLLDQHFITRESSALITQALYEYFDENNIKPNIAYEIDSTEAIKEAVSSSNHLALLPLISVNKAVKNKNIAILPITIPKKYATNSWYIIHKRDKPFNTITENFLDFVLEKLDCHS